MPETGGARGFSGETWVEQSKARVIGSVESVAPNRIVARLSQDSPQTTALNAGVPVPFPRLNGFVIVPHESGALVGLVTWIGVSQAGIPARASRAEPDLIDLPFPARRMMITPIGTLEREQNGGNSRYELQRGVTVFPSVGDAVSIPSGEQLQALMAGDAARQHVKIGSALLANNADVKVDPNKLFGRHLAVLGNTGSGKSCSVAGLIRWSIEEAQNARENGSEGPASSRFIVLDPNGEYGSAFDDIDGVALRRYRVDGGFQADPLHVPGWLMNSHEWASVTYASARVQKPILTGALRGLRERSARQAEQEGDLVPAASAVCREGAADLRVSLRPNGFPKNTDEVDFGKRLLKLASALRYYGSRLKGDEALRVHEALAHVEGLVKDFQPSAQFAKYLMPAHEARQEAIDKLARVADLSAGREVLRVHEDSPVRFDIADLGHELDAVARGGQFEDARRFIGGLRLRVDSLVEDERMNSVLAVGTQPQPDLGSWLAGFLGDGAGDSIAVIDLSLVPADVVEVVTAVAARVIFEALQRHRRRPEGKVAPTVLVLEEAHTFVRERSFNDEYTTPGALCTQAFERIAREGRKFGLGLVISSQRPSELSETVLAQCNSFLLHRIVNHRDQELVGKLVPDNLAGMLDELPALPSRHALLVGWAAPFPTLVQMRELEEIHRPHSDDPDYWGSWTGARPVDTDWSTVADEWVGASKEAGKFSEGPGFTNAEGGSGGGDTVPAEVPQSHSPATPFSDPWSTPPVPDDDIPF